MAYRCDDGWVRSTIASRETPLTATLQNSRTFGAREDLDGPGGARTERRSQSQIHSELEAVCELTARQPTVHR